MKMLSQWWLPFFLMVWFVPGKIWCLGSDELIALRRAGLSDAAIQTIIQEKVVETAAFSVEEIVDMKRAGFSDALVQTIVREGSFMKDAEPVVYGRNLSPVTMTTVQDLIELKKSGFSDEVIQAVIQAGSDRTEASEREKAWEMLREMGVVIDERRRRFP
ncbi:hypothetical protein TRIP_B200654 [uncultured Desulfatiglans sp.]|uniref:Uncharacterized protein n=1 Tax=Uncultured Desulfatiglans sp. TaxID=1748965 RepID=A0A653A3D2_UNCDX|nr:hypothetical protein TRIP_B200654 [uncultured Desulfatiglans sp.]